MDSEPRPLPSTGITRFQRYYGPLRHPQSARPVPRGSPVWRSRHRHRGGFPCCFGSPYIDMPPPVPRRDRWIKSLVGRRIPAEDQESSDDGLPQDIDGSAPTTDISRPHRKFTFVAACLLAEPPSGPLHRRLRRYRHLHRRSDCYRLERLKLPGGNPTRSRSKPFHGAQCPRFPSSNQLNARQYLIRLLHGRTLAVNH